MSPYLLALVRNELLRSMDDMDRWAAAFYRGYGRAAYHEAMIRRGR